MATGFFALLRYVSLRHVVAAPLRSLLTLLGVALGVSAIVAMGSVDDAILGAFREMVDRAGGKADFEVVGDESGVPQELVVALADRREVAHVAAVIEKTTLIGSDARPLSSDARALVLGVDVLSDLSLLPFEPAAPGASSSALVDDPLAFVNDPSAILLTETLARALSVHRGDSVRMRVGDGVRTFHVEALLRDAREGKMFGDLVAILSLDAAQEVFGERGRVDRIDVQLAPGIDAARAERDLGGLVAGRAELAPPARRAAQSAQMLESIRVGLDLSAAIAVLIGMLLVYDAAAVAVARRRQELATLRVLGAPRGVLLLSVVAEALVVALVGSLLGVGLGAAIARVVMAQVAPTVSRLYQPIVTAAPHVSARLALAAIAIGAGATLVASFVPARRGAHTAPMEALRRDAIMTSARALPARRLAIFGLLGAAAAQPSIELLLRRPGVPAILPGVLELFAVAIGFACSMPLVIIALHRVCAAPALSLFGIAARLGVDNVRRSLGGSALTAAALMLAMCTSVAVSAFASSMRAAVDEWLEQTTPADVLVTAGSPVLNRQAITFSPSVVDRLTSPKIDGVDAIDVVRTVRVSFRGRRFLLQASDTAFCLSPARRGAFRRTIEGDGELAPEDLRDRREIVISENLARAFDLHPGASLELETPRGLRTFLVRAVVVDYSSAMGWALIDRRWMLEDWGDDRVDLFKLFAHSDGRAGSDAEIDAIRAEVSRRLSSSGDEALFVSSGNAVKEEVRESISRSFALTSASQLIAFVVAILGVASAMITAVIDRTRELGVLRAIGASRRQVRLAILAEATFLGLTSASIGLAASVPTSWVLTKVVGVAATGWDVPFVYPTRFALQVAATVVLAAAGSAWFPARRASRLVVTDALAWE